MEFKRIRTNTPLVGFSLSELMVTLGLSTVVAAGILSFYLYSNQTFANLTNHVLMEQHNSYVIDLLSKQIRQTKRLIGYSSTSLTFADADSNSLQFIYDSAAQTLSRISLSTTNILLTNCTSLQFQIYPDSMQSSAFDVTSNATNAAQCRIVGITWNCARVTRGVTNSEPLQGAKVLIRNASGS
jgi:hypothetical protein